METKKLIKKDFYSSRQVISLDSVDISKIIVSNKWKINDTSVTFFIGYMDENIIKPLCIILPQMSELIKYFDNGKSMSFMTEDKEVWGKIWVKIKKLLGLKFGTNPIRDEKYLTSKVKTFNGINKATFTDDKIPKEKNHYICIAAINIGSVLKKEVKKVYPNAYLGQCTYKLKKRKPVDFIDKEVELSSESDYESN